MRRALASAFALLVVSATTAMAQSPGTIYYEVSNPQYGVDSLYAVSGNGGPVTTLANTTAWYGPSARTDHQGGRLFLVPGLSLGADPVTNIPFANIYAGNPSTGSTFPVTDVPGPRLVIQSNIGSQGRWSNDNQDSFISFTVLDTETDTYHLYRGWLSGPLDATFTPFTLLDGDDLADPVDGRLELMASYTTLFSYAWSGDGTKFAYLDPGGSLRLHVVGPDTSLGNDPVILPVTGFRNLSLPTYSPTSEQIVLYARTADVTSGLVSVSPVNGTWVWLQKASKTYQSFGTPYFSPDGTAVAFSASVSRKNKWYPCVAKASASVASGTISTVTEAPNIAISRSLSGWRW